MAPWMMGPRSLTQYQLPKINAVNKGGLSCEVRGGADVDPHNTFSAGDEIAGRLAIYPKESNLGSLPCSALARLLSATSRGPEVRATDGASLFRFTLPGRRGAEIEANLFWLQRE